MKKDEAAKVKVEEKSVIVPEEPGLPMEMDFSGDAGQGFENTSMDDFVVPFLTILQKMSPVCDEDDPAHIDGAKPGLFFNLSTQQVYEELIIVPAAYQRMFAEWVPRESGGGFRGHHLPESPEVSSAQRDDHGKFVLKNGNHLTDTRYHFVLLLSNGRPDRAVIAMSSTQIKKSRLWMTAMRNLEMTTPDGKKFTPPMFSHVYRLTTVAESNDQGTWKGYKIECARSLTKEEGNVYQAAKDFRKEVESGRIKVEESERGASESNANPRDDDGIPF